MRMYFAYANQPGELYTLIPYKNFPMQITNDDDDCNHRILFS